MLIVLFAALMVLAVAVLVVAVVLPALGAGYDEGAVGRYDVFGRTS